MGVRDDELTRLIKYAEGMGLRVIIKNRPRGGDASASWALDGSEIAIYNSDGDSKTDLILSLIHELGHQIWFVHEKDRQPDPKVDEAVTRQELFDEKLHESPAPKNLRKEILDMEKKGTLWWDSIYKETNMKFPMWKLEAAKEFDLWQYEVYYETGFFPKRDVRRDYRAKVRTKYRNKYDV